MSASAGKMIADESMGGLSSQRRDLERLLACVTAPKHQAAMLILKNASPHIDDWLRRYKAPTGEAPVDGRAQPVRFDKGAWKEHELKQNPLRAIGIKKTIF